MASSKTPFAWKRKPSSKAHHAKHTKHSSSAKSSPRFNVPYFAHDALDPNIYPASVRQPVGGPCPTDTTTQRDEEDYEGGLADSSSDDGNPPEPLSASSVKKQKFSASPITPGYRKVRVEGGRSAMPKKVVWNLDSDDEIIVQMKQDRYTDKEVVERLIKEGRTKYHHKTISSRWVRLKRVLAAHEDEMLDAQLTDWHEGDDDLLLEAITSADREVYQRKQKVAEEKWKVVAENLKAAKPTANYSQNACRDRFEALENDSATIPPELDDFPEKRRMQRAAVEEAYGAGFSGAGQTHDIATFEVKGDAGDENHAAVLLHRSMSSSKAGANGHGKPGMAQHFKTTFPNVNTLDSVHEDTVSSADGSGVDYGEQSDGSVTLSPDVMKTTNQDSHKSRYARQGKNGVSTIPQHNAPAVSNGGSAKAHLTGVPLFAYAAGGNSKSPHAPVRSMYRA